MIVCITNDIADVRPCTVRGAHAANCDGWEYGWNPDMKREEATGRDCHGCLPRPARHGLVCGTCWENIVAGIDRFPALARMLDGVERAVQRDNAGVRSKAGPPIPLTSLVLDLDEAASLLGSFAGSPEMWVASHQGAADAVRFGRAFRALERNHPVQERPHKLRRLRCPECNRLSFVWNPPEDLGGTITVTCQNDGCGKTIREHDTTSDGAEKIAIVADIESIRRMA